MQASGLSFHHPASFWTGCLAITAGVLLHVPMFMHSVARDYMMAGMGMDGAMLFGMVLIPVGVLLAAYGLLPRFAILRQGIPANQSLCFHASDTTDLNREHWKLIAVLIIALTIDVMKPATLGFIMPGVINEYAISAQTAGFLPLVALTGTTIGSVLWGYLADRFGRRAAILLSALMFIGTAICGAMPSFEWNLAMCFFMGLSAGGLLPITFTLMAEMVPAAHRGWALVALGGIGTSAGYLVAAGAANLLEPLFSWRVLWLLGLPTGLIIIFLDRHIPESPRFLANAGLIAQAKAVLAKFAVTLDAPAADAPGNAESASDKPASGMRQLLRSDYAFISYGLIVAGVAWGLVNFGFLLWLPSNLRAMGMDASGATELLARSALYALPGIGLVILLYHRWSSIRTLVLFIAFTAATLLAFFAIQWAGIQSTASMMAATALLLIGSSGVIAMLIPYAAEIYPVHLRATGSGVVAASSKAGGILGAAFGVFGLFNDVGQAALLIALPMAGAAMLLYRSGIDTRGRRLEEIGAALARKADPVL
jgi:putative MFS transporter